MLGRCEEQDKAPTPIGLTVWAYNCNTEHASRTDVDVTHTHPGWEQQLQDNTHLQTSLQLPSWEEANPDYSSLRAIADSSQGNTCQTEYVWVAGPAALSVGCKNYKETSCPLEQNHNTRMKRPAHTILSVCLWAFYLVGRGYIFLEGRHCTLLIFKAWHQVAIHWLLNNWRATVTVLLHEWSLFVHQAGLTAAHYQPRQLWI